MADKTIESINHNYEPVNKYIDDQARLKRSVSSWRYAKSTALVLVAAGILAVLLAWAYYIYKKPHNFFNNNSSAYTEKVKKKVSGKKVVYFSKVTRFDSSYVEGYTISTGYRWDTVDDLRYGKKHVDDWCYIAKNGATYYFNNSEDQSAQLQLLGLARSEVIKYSDYCTN